MNFSDFKGAAKKLDDVDLPREGATIGVGEDVLHGFLDCESRGSGFDAQGRILCLYEPHVFYRLLNKLKDKTKLNAAVKAGVAYPAWGQQKYPKDSYPRLLKAMQIDETAALRSCSWGLFQVMGENFLMLGYSSVQDMIKAFREDEEAHLRGCIDFIRTSGIADDLRQLDSILKKRDATAAECAPIVRVYNGPGYSKNGYHTKFAQSVNKWRKIKDTPLPGAAKVDAPVQSADIYDGKPHEEVRKVQAQLRTLGWPEVGNPDGKWGTRTEGAIASFRTTNGLPAGKIDDELLVALMRAPQRPVSDERAKATAADLKDAPSVQSGFTLLTTAKTMIGGAVATAVGKGTVDLTDANDKIVQAQTLYGTISSISPYLVIGAVAIAGVVLFVLGRKFITEQVQAYREGRHV